MNLTTDRAVLLALGLFNTLAVFSLAYDDAGFSIQQPWRFVVALLATGTGFLLISLRSWAESRSVPLPHDPHAEPHPH